MKTLLAASLLAASLLPAAPATAAACVHDHPNNGGHGGSPHVHYPQCHDNSPGDRPGARGHQHRGDTQHRPAQQQLPACVHANPPESHIPECVDAVDGPSTGGCSFVAVGSGQLTGEIDIEAVVYSANPADNPMSATFTCYVKVNGATQPGAVVTATGTGTVAGGGFITYTSNSVTDFVQLCQDVSYSNGTNTSECFEAESFEVPPPIVWEIVDPLVCPIIAVAAPGAGPMYINSQGDVWVDGEGSYDCPPYGNVFGFPPNG